MKVLLVEDHPTTRFGAKTVVELAEGIEVVGEAEHADEALDLIKERKPDLVLLDLKLRGGNDGIELCREVKSLSDPPYILVYSAYNSPEDIAACRLCDADGYIHKSEDPEQLLEALEKTRAGGSVWLLGVDPEEPDAKLAEALAGAELTPREREVYELVRKGRTNPQITEELHIGAETVKTHVKNVLDKLGYESRYEIP